MTILIPSAPVEVKMDGRIMLATMIGRATRDPNGKAVLVEVHFKNGRHSLVPWKDVSTCDNVGLHLLGPEVMKLTKKTEKT